MDIARMLKRIVFTIFMFSVLLNGFIIGASAEGSEGAEEKKTVVVIQSYTNEDKWAKDMPLGIRFQSKISDVRIVQLRYEDYESDDYFASFASLCKYQYLNTKVDSVVTIGEPAERFVTNHGAELFGEANVYITSTPLWNKEKNKEFYYIDSNMDIVGIIKDIFEIQPNLEELVIVSDVDHRYEWVDYSQLSQLGKLKDKVTIIETGSVEDVINALGKERKNKAVLLEPIGARIKNNAISAKSFCQRLSSLSEVPIYSMWVMHTNYKVTGVKGYSSFLQGKELQRIILGEVESNAFVDGNVYIMEEPNWKYDYVHIKKYDFANKESILANKIIFNVPKKVNITIWIGGIAVISIFLILVNFLSFNIVKRKAAENSVEKSRIELDEIKENSKLKSDFFANITHDIRTPIGVILSITQLLELTFKSGNLSEEKVTKYYDSIRSNCNQLMKISNNLIDMTKIESGFMKLEKHNYELIGLIENLVFSISELSNSKEIDLIFDTEIEEIEIFCDGHKVERVIMNLLSNAMKFTPKGGNIQVNMMEKNGEIGISVKDSGIGIPQKKLIHIFDRFDMVDGNQEINNYGSGIGLYIVKSIMEKHEGRVEVYSEENVGTEFICYLPIIRNEEKDVIYTYLNDDYQQKIDVEFADVKK